jgi:hypothetical protein
MALSRGKRTEIIYTKRHFFDARDLRLPEGKQTKIIHLKASNLPESIFFQYGIQTVHRHSL